MAKVISMTLDPTDISEAVKEIRKYEKWVSEKALDLIEAMCREGESFAINEVGHIKTGATVGSIRGYRKGNEGFIVASGDINEDGVCTAVWIEFGTGVYHNGGGYPHEKAQELGMSAIGTYGEGKGSNPDGWWYKGKDGKAHHTRGIKAQMFMWNTLKYLKEYAPEIASEVFK